MKIKKIKNTCIKIKKRMGSKVRDAPGKSALKQKSHREYKIIFIQYF